MSHNVNMSGLGRVGKTGFGMKDFLLILSTGFATFAMFFGSGNLVFPLQIGVVTQGFFPFSSVGLLLTGVLVPLMGLMAILMKDGSSELFFATLGKRAAIILPLIMLSLLGPFAIVPRCTTVAYGSFAALFPDVSLGVFSLVFSVINYLLLRDSSKLVSRIGFILTPVLLLSLYVLIFFGIINGPEMVTPSQLSPFQSFYEGLHRGYQTMDLIAAFFFAAIVTEHIRKKVGSDVSWSETRMITAQSLGIGALLLGIIYVAFVYLGAAYAPILGQVSPEKVLGVIAGETLGNYAGPILCAAVILACLTTSVALIEAFSEFIHRDILKERVPYQGVIIGSIVVSFLISLSHFTGIMAYLGPILDVVYPGLVLLTVLTLLEPVYKFPYTREAVYLTFIITGIFEFFL